MSKDNIDSKIVDLLFNKETKKNVAEKRRPQDYPIINNEFIDKISITGNYQYYGSIIYKAQPISNDIDGIELMKYCDNKCDKQTAIKKLKNDIQNYVKRLVKDKSLYLGDIKIGIDIKLFNALNTNEFKIVKPEELGFNKDKNWDDFDELIVDGTFEKLWISKDKKEGKNDYSRFYVDKNRNIVPKNKIDKNSTIEYFNQIIFTFFSQFNMEYDYEFEDKYFKYVRNNFMFYFPEWAKLYLTNALKQGFINQEIYDTLNKFIGKSKTVYEYAELYEFLRNQYILRWTANDIANGYTTSVVGYKITIEEAIDSCINQYLVNRFNYYNPKKRQLQLKKDSPYLYYNSQQSIYNIIKFDIIARRSDKLIEMSNLLEPTYKDKSGKEKQITFTYSLKGEKEKPYIEYKLIQECIKFYLGLVKKDNKPFKYAKRLFSLAITKDMTDISEKLIPLWKSEFNVLNNVLSQLSTLIYLCEKSERLKPEIQDIYNELDRQKQPLTSIISIKGYNSDKYIDVINKIINDKLANFDQIYELLKKMKEELTEYLNEGTISYLKSVDLYPAKFFYKEPEDIFTEFDIFIL